jgi:hypothetical protein
MKVLLVLHHVFAGGTEKASLDLAYHLNHNELLYKHSHALCDTRVLPLYLTRLNYLVHEKPLSGLVEVIP